MTEPSEKQGESGGGGFWSGFWQVASAVLLDTRWGPFVRFVILMVLLTAIYRILDLDISMLPLGSDGLSNFTG